MQVIGDFFNVILRAFQLELNVFGYVFSFWDIFLFTLAASIVLAFIGGVLFD